MTRITLFTMKPTSKNIQPGTYKPNTTATSVTTTAYRQQEIHSLPQQEGYGWLHVAKRIALLIAGALIMSFNLNTFVPAAQTLPGGFAGVTVLTQRIASTFFNYTVSYSLIYLLLNSVPAIISFFFIGRKFTLYSLVMIVLSSVFTDILPLIIQLPPPSSNTVICAVFGGLCNASAVYCCLMAGATSGGTDFIAIFISERWGKDAWNYILTFNILVLCVSGFLFNWEMALYSMVFQFVSTQTINYLYKRYKKATLLVISEHWEEIFELIKETTHHDATLFRGIGYPVEKTRHLLYCVVSADEVRRLTPAIREIDPKAFINILKTQELLGHFYRKPND